MDHDKFNDYCAAVHTGENAEDALKNGNDWLIPQCDSLLKTLREAA